MIWFTSRGRIPSLARGAVAALGLAVACLLAWPGFAYVPPASFILKEMAANLRHGGYRHLRITGTATVYHPVLAPLPVTGTFEDLLLVPGRWLTQVKAPDGAIIMGVVPGKRALWVPPQSPQRESPVEYALFETLLTGGKDEGASLVQAVKEAGVDTATVSYGRIGTKVCWIIGAKPKDFSRPQVWVEQTRILPARVISFGRWLSPDGKPNRIWAELSGYDSPPAYEQIPARMEIRIGEDTWLVRNVDHVSSDKSLTEGQFVLP